MAHGGGVKAAYENPLIPPARLRQMYRAMAQARMLEKALPAARRGRGLGARGSGTQVAGTLGLEACLVSTSIDLRPGDLVSDALSGGVVDFVRGAALRAVLRPGEARHSHRLATGVLREARSMVEYGAATRLPDAPGVAERIWEALGAAAALKAAASRAKPHAKSSAQGRDPAGTRVEQPHVVVVYARPGELTPALWRKALTFAAQQDLPVVFVVLRAGPVRKGKARAAKVGGVGALALGCGVPAIAVDADDAVAIYRVAQESIGRARAGGGAALMECVPFVVEGALGRRNERADAIVVLERYMLQRGVATETWIKREAKSFAQQIARQKAAVTKVPRVSISRSSP